MKTFKEYLDEGQQEHLHIKRMMDTIHPTKRAAARKAYQVQKSKGQPHASALTAMRVFAEDVEQFDSLVEVVVVSSFPTIQKAIKDSHTPSKKEFDPSKTIREPIHTDELTGKTKMSQSKKAKALGLF